MTLQVVISSSDNYFVLEDALILLFFSVSQKPHLLQCTCLKKANTTKQTKRIREKGKHSQGSLYAHFVKNIFKCCKGVVECLLDGTYRCYTMEPPWGFSISCYLILICRSEQFARDRIWQLWLSFKLRLYLPVYTLCKSSFCLKWEGRFAEPAVPCQSLFLHLKDEHRLVRLLQLYLKYQN